MIIIGSSAIKYWYSDFKRDPKDLDIILGSNNNNLEFAANGRKVELLENDILYKKYGNNFDGCISSNDLTTLKASHLCWNINWEKHMYDLQFLIKKGNKIDFKLFNELYDYWNVIHSKNKRSDLKMSKEDFFDNAVNYNENEHDRLHEILNSLPVYTTILKDGCDVELDENKWNNLMHPSKEALIREEVMVMAYERYKSLGYKHAYNKMLKKFIISHAPFWSVIFILENYIELQKCGRNFIKEIENGIKRIN